MEVPNTLSVIWDRCCLWCFVNGQAFEKHSDPLSHVLWLGMQACITQHSAQDGHVYRAVHYRNIYTLCILALRHFHMWKYLCTWMAAVMVTACFWPLTCMIEVHCLDPGPHLMHSPLCIRRVLLPIVGCISTFTSSCAEKLVIQVEYWIEERQITVIF